MGLMSASSKYDSVPNVDLSVERTTKKNIRKDRGKDGKLNICRLSSFDMHQVISVLESLPSALLNKGDTNLIILDTGCSIIDTGFIDEFVEGIIVWL